MAKKQQVAKTALRDDVLSVLQARMEARGPVFEDTIASLATGIGALSGRETPSASAVNYWVQKLTKLGIFQTTSQGPRNPTIFDFSGTKDRKSPESTGGLEQIRETVEGVLTRYAELKREREKLQQENEAMRAEFARLAEAS